VTPSRPRLTIGIALALGSALAACAGVPAPPCRGAEKAMVVETVYFGTNKPGGVVSAEEWREFVNREITPRFPEGLTSWEAAGQWRSADGKIEREGSHVLRLMHGDAAAPDQAVAEIMSAYKRAFRQEAVLRVRTQGCASF
jgi:uncharacterized protein DUF3574